MNKEDNEFYDKLLKVWDKLDYYRLIKPNRIKLGFWIWYLENILKVKYNIGDD